MKFPEEGLPEDEVMRQLEELGSSDARWESGRILTRLSTTPMAPRIYPRFTYINAIYSKLFPSIGRMEREIVGMLGDLLGHPQCVGNVTSGGTESNIMAMKVARDIKLKENPRIRPEIVAPVTSHPSVNKVAELLGLKVKRIGVDETLKAIPSLMREAVTDDTIALVATAGTPTHGVVDPIPEIAKVARETNLFLHVDAALGGFVIPFAKRLGYKIPDFDFSVAGVSTISIDPHKMGMGMIPAGCLLYRSEELREPMKFNFGDWNGGRYQTSTVLGSRNGASVAIAWAVMKSLGLKGYIQNVQQLMRLTHEFSRGIGEVPGLHVIVEPEINVVAFTSDEFDIFAVKKELERLGWVGMGGTQRPAGLHIVVMPYHDGHVEAFLSDLRLVCEKVKREGLTATAELDY